MSAFPAKAKQGAPIEVTVTLENVGEGSFYIPKWLRTSATPAVPGFDIDLRQNGRSVCRSETDWTMPSPKKRKPAVILKEDYFLLPPDFSLTYRETVGTCGREPLPVGTYEIHAAYSGQLATSPDFRKIRTDFPVLQTVINAEPITIEITE